MTFLVPESDRAVRTAVDAYLQGRIRPEMDGEAVFETRNSRYRLMDGILFSASDESLLGAELVGWLTENDGQAAVGAWWRPAARAVLVDRRHGRHIVVTSATRLLRTGAGARTSDGSPAAHGGSVTAHVTDYVPNAQVRAAAAAALHTPEPPAEVRPVIPSTRPAQSGAPAGAASSYPPPPNAAPPARHAIPTAPAARRSPIPPCPPLPQQRPLPRAAPPPMPAAQPLSMRSPIPHAPPRPIAKGPAAPAARPPMPSASPEAIAARPLPFPAPPPRPAPDAPLPRFPIASTPRPPGSAHFEDEGSPTERRARPFAPPGLQPSFAVRQHPLPPPPGPLASPPSAPPPPHSEPFQLQRASRIQRGLPLR